MNSLQEQLSASTRALIDPDKPHRRTTNSAPPRVSMRAGPASAADILQATALFSDIHNILEEKVTGAIPSSHQ